MGSVDQLVDFLLVYFEVDRYGNTVFIFLLSVENARYVTILRTSFVAFLPSAAREVPLIAICFIV
ncbi:hypothetical protein EVA_12619 [gut metagenome]|uniref:Uncharacterized protein n=1 Tax=gut metagenome TaxID=749906 RepID=J9CGV9_9ZZZZ